jgi:hypothetical protein
METQCSSFSSNLHAIATLDTCTMISMTDISSFADRFNQNGTQSHWPIDVSIVVHQQQQRLPIRVHQTTSHHPTSKGMMHRAAFKGQPLQPSASFTTTTDV